MTPGPGATAKLLLSDRSENVSIAAPTSSIIDPTGNPPQGAAGRMH